MDKKDKEVLVVTKSSALNEGAHIVEVFGLVSGSLGALGKVCSRDFPEANAVVDLLISYHKCCEEAEWTGTAVRVSGLNRG